MNIVYDAAALAGVRVVSVHALGRDAVYVDGFRLVLVDDDLDDDAAELVAADLLRVVVEEATVTP